MPESEYEEDDAGEYAQELVDNQGVSNLSVAYNYLFNYRCPKTTIEISLSLKLLISSI